MARSMITLSGELLRQRAVTLSQLDKALTRQRLAGGRLATALLEVTPIDEVRLLQIIAQTQAVAAASPGCLGAPQEVAVSAVPADLAVTHGLLPWSLYQDRLTIIVDQPLSAEIQQQLEFSLGFKLCPRLALHERLQQALKARYGIELSPRTERLLARLDGLSAALDSPEPERCGTNHVPALTVPPLPIESLVQPVSTRESLVPLSSQSPAHVDVTTSDGPVSLPLVSDEMPPSSRIVFSVETAKKCISRSRTEIDVVWAWFEFSKQFFEYTAAFAVREDMAEGLCSWGPGASSYRVRCIGVPLEMSSLLSRASEARHWVLREPDKEGIDLFLGRDLRRPMRAKVLAIPVVVHGKVLLLLYGDGGDWDVDVAQVADVLLVTQLAANRLAVLVTDGQADASPRAQDQPRQTHETAELAGVPETLQAGGRAELPILAAPADHPDFARDFDRSEHALEQSQATQEGGAVCESPSDDVNSARPSRDQRQRLSATHRAMADRLLSSGLGLQAPLVMERSDSGLSSAVSATLSVPWNDRPQVHRVYGRDVTEGMSSARVSIPFFPESLAGLEESSRIPSTPRNERSARDSIADLPEGFRTRATIPVGPYPSEDVPGAGTPSYSPPLFGSSSSLSFDLAFVTQANSVRVPSVSGNMKALDEREAPVLDPPPKTLRQGGVDGFAGAVARRVVGATPRTRATEGVETPGIRKNAETSDVAETSRISKKSETSENLPTPEISADAARPLARRERTPWPSEDSVEMVAVDGRTVEALLEEWGQEALTDDVVVDWLEQVDHDAASSFSEELPVSGAAPREACAKGADQNRPEAELGGAVELDGEFGPDSTEQEDSVPRIDSDKIVVQEPVAPPKPVLPSDVGLPSVMVDLGQDAGLLLDRLVAPDLTSIEATMIRSQLISLGSGWKQAAVERLERYGNTYGALLDWTTGKMPVLTGVAGARSLTEFLVDSATDFATELGQFFRQSKPPANQWALWLLAQRGGRVARDALLSAVFDADEAIRLAGHVIVGVVVGNRAWANAVRAQLRLAARQSAYPQRRIFGLLGVGSIRESSSVPLLLRALREGDAAVRVAASSALCDVTFRDFGEDEQAWAAWWGRHCHSPRYEWLLEGLRSERVRQRRRALAEIEQIVGQSFGYDAALPAATQHQAIESFRRWFEQNHSTT